jgi:hypothetical protein
MRFGDEVSLNSAWQAQTTPLHFFFMATLRMYDRSWRGGLPASLRRT